MDKCFEDMVVDYLEGANQRGVSVRLTNKMIASHKSMASSFLFSKVSKYSYTPGIKFDDYLFEGKLTGNKESVISLRKFHNSGKGLVTVTHKEEQEFNILEIVQLAFKLAMEHNPEMSDEEWDSWEQKLEEARSSNQ